MAPPKSRNSETRTSRSPRAHQPNLLRRAATPPRSTSTSTSRRGRELSETTPRAGRGGGERGGGVEGGVDLDEGAGLLDGQHGGLQLLRIGGAAGEPLHGGCGGGGGGGRFRFRSRLACCGRSGSRRSPPARCRRGDEAEEEAGMGARWRRRRRRRWMGLRPFFWGAEVKMVRRWRADVAASLALCLLIYLFSFFFPQWLNDWILD